ncbi:MAG: hypothetical protein ACTSYB_06350 [Candidatus Helarchaeota archaeon]
MTSSTIIWDTRADAIKEGDNLREILPFKQYEDSSGFIHYVFTKEMFYNPRYIIPKDDFTLFYNFLRGGSREYPSDGNIPVDIVADEAKKVLNHIKKIAENPTHKFHASAKKILAKGVNHLLRGTIKLYLGEYTTRDWRRKRSTDDIDFWISDNNLFEFVLSELYWVKNKKTKEWEKKVHWIDIWTGKLKQEILIASNDTVQGLDFGAGSHLEGPRLKDIIKKKIIRGHDVDLSDIINVAIVNNIPKSTDLTSPWAAFEECANMRHSRVNSNLISLCRYAHGIADYLQRVGESIQLYKDLVLHESFIPNKEINRICKLSSHWLKKMQLSPTYITRERIYNNLLRQEQKKRFYSNTLRNFAYRVIDLLNSKIYEQNIIFEIADSVEMFDSTSRSPLHLPTKSD